MGLEFEWDEEKARTHFAKHRVSFLRAAEVFANEIPERIDDREDYRGVRWIAPGRADTEVFVWCTPGAATGSSASSAPGKPPYTCGWANDVVDWFKGLGRAT